MYFMQVITEFFLRVFFFFLNYSLINSLQLSFMNSFHEARRSFPVLLCAVQHSPVCGICMIFPCLLKAIGTNSGFGPSGTDPCLFFFLFSFFCIELRRTFCVSWQFAPQTRPGASERGSLWKYKLPVNQRTITLQ